VTAVPRRRFEIGAGRTVGPLLFLTDSKRPADRIGASATTVVRAAVEDGGHELCDVAGGGRRRRSFEQIAAALREQIDDEVPAQVVIVGGYDVVPARQVDAIAPETPADMISTLRRQDPDAFVVWSDDPYVDIDGVGLADLPISRIPDAHDAVFTLHALQAAPGRAAMRHGIRNAARPFVDSIFEQLPGRSALLVSRPSDAGNLDRRKLRGGLAYYMLHGAPEDATRFWGEDQARTRVEAVRVDQVPSEGIQVAVLGCCWGALSVPTKACDWRPAAPIVGRTAEESIALTLLGAGAIGVIGCTGAHYSPVSPPYDTASGPFHRALWQRLASGEPPARALFDAKYDVAQGLPSITDPTALAIANKTLNQFTCLGLGC
jgi:hypothetical protein